MTIQSCIITCIFYCMINQSCSKKSIIQIVFSAAFDRVTIMEFCISSALWVLGVLCFLY